MSSSIKFESENKIENDRQLLRQQREKYLKKLEKNYTKEEDLKKKQLESILPSIHKRVEQDEHEQQTSKKKHRDKMKKKKKSKGSKESNSEEEVWVEKLNNDEQEDLNYNKPLKREGWMMMDIFTDKLMIDAVKKLDTKKVETTIVELGQTVRELNPYWRDGGSGLPPEHNKTQNFEVKKQRSTERNNIINSGNNKLLDENEFRDKINNNIPKRISDKKDDKKEIRFNKTLEAGDGGLEWWNRALQRCKEMAQSEGKTLEEVASERYGSLKCLKEKIEKAKTHCLKEKTFQTSSSYSKYSFKKPLLEEDISHQYESFKNEKNNNFIEEKNYNEEYKCKTLKARWRTNEKNDKYYSKNVSFLKEDLEKSIDQKSNISSKDDDSDENYDDDSINDKNILKEEPVLVLNEAERNKLSAKLIKAELMGDEDLVKELKTKLDNSQSSSLKKPKIFDDSGNFEILQSTNRKGMVRPITFNKNIPMNEKNLKKRKNQKLETHKDGKRVKYFRDDDNYTLKDLVEQEKLQTSEDTFRLYSQLSNKKIINDDQDIDEEVLNKEANRKDKSNLMNSRDKQLAIIEHVKMSSTLDKCSLCFNNALKHLIIAIAKKVYLSLPKFRSLVNGHCLISPMHHISQSTASDEDILDEIRVFMKNLVDMFKLQGKECIFMETSKNLKRHPHLFIECIPIEKQYAQDAQIFFKKALLETGSEWSQNKKFIDLKDKTIKKAIPTGFPYFRVQFDMNNGFAHIIDDDRNFPDYFGKEIIGGMLDLDAVSWRKPQQEKFEDQCKKVLDFSKQWKPFDWTIKKIII